MENRILTLQISSYWHPGTGRGDGAVADASVHVGTDHLPFLPGRTVKGLLRDAVECAIQAGFEGLDPVALFGSPLPRATTDDRVRTLEEARFTTDSGCLRFGSARPGRGPTEQATWSEWAGAHPEQAAVLVERIASTKVDDLGRAEDHTLRTIEVVVPMTLHAAIEGPPGTRWDLLDEAVQTFLTGLGSHRTRGLGRVHARLEQP